MSSSVRQISRVAVLLCACVLLNQGLQVQAQAHSYNATQDPPTEREALIHLYNVTGGATWLNSSNWLHPTISMCDWYGISCVAPSITNVTEINHISSIQLSNNSLYGTLPSRIMCSFPHMTVLALTSNGGLSGPLPNVACLGSSLTQVLLDQCSFSGPVPHFGNNTHLQTITLDANQLQGGLPQTWINNLTQLITLDISNNALLNGSFPSPLGCSRLDSLALSSCSFSGAFPSLHGLPELTTLDISFNHFTELPDFQNNTQLIGLYAMNNMISSFPVSFPGSILSVWLSHNVISSPIPRMLYELPRLESVWLDHNLITGTLPHFNNTLHFTQFDVSCNMMNTTNITQAWPAAISDLNLMCYNAPFNHTCTQLCSNIPSSSSSSSTGSISSTGGAMSSSSSSSTGFPSPSADASSSSVFTWAGIGVGFAAGAAAVLVILVCVKWMTRRQDSASINAEYTSMP